MNYCYLLTFFISFFSISNFKAASQSEDPSLLASKKYSTKFARLIPAAKSHELEGDFSKITGITQDQLELIKENYRRKLEGKKASVGSYSPEIMMEEWRATKKVFEEGVKSDLLLDDKMHLVLPLQILINKLFVLNEALKVRRQKKDIKEDLRFVDAIIVDTASQALTSLSNPQDKQFSKALSIMGCTEKALVAIDKVHDFLLIGDKTIDHYIKSLKQVVSNVNQDSELGHYGALMLYLVHQAVIIKKTFALQNLEYSWNSYQRDESSFTDFKEKQRAVSEKFIKISDGLSILIKMIFSDNVPQAFINEANSGLHDLLKDIYKDAYKILLDEFSKDPYGQDFLAINYRGIGFELPISLDQQFIKVSTDQDIPEQDQTNYQRAHAKYLKKMGKEAIALKKSKKPALKLEKVKKDIEASSGQEILVSLSKEQVLLDQVEKDEEDVRSEEKTDSSGKKKKKKKKKPTEEVSAQLESFDLDQVCPESSLQFRYTQSARLWQTDPDFILKRDGYLIDGAGSEEQQVRRRIFLEELVTYGQDFEAAKMSVINRHTLPTMIDRELITDYSNRFYPLGGVPLEEVYITIPLLKRESNGNYIFGQYQLYYRYLSNCLVQIYHKLFKPFAANRLRGEFVMQANEVIEQQNKQEEQYLKSLSLMTDEELDKQEWVISSEWIREAVSVGEGMIRFRNQKTVIEYYLMSN